MFKRTIAVAMSVVGLIVGAGFSSGQEVLQYFVAFGKMGIWGGRYRSGFDVRCWNDCVAAGKLLPS